MAHACDRIPDLKLSVWNDTLQKPYGLDGLYGLHSYDEAELYTPSALRQTLTRIQANIKAKVIAQSIMDIGFV